MRQLRYIVIASLTFALVGDPQAASAGADERDKQEAASLFKEGITFFDRGEFDKACAKFEASLELFDGIGTRGKLAECYERQGRLASAWRLYREVVRLAKKRGEKRRAKVAAKRAKKLKPQLPRLVIKGGPSEALDGFTIEHNRVEMHASTYGKRIYVDPGTHLIVASAYDHKSWQKKVTIELGQTQTITVPKLRPSSSRLDEPDVDDATDDGSDDGSVVSERNDLFDDRTSPSLSGTRVSAGIVFGLSAVSMGVTLYFGNEAREYTKDFRDGCEQDSVRCDPQYEEPYLNAKQNAMRADYAAIATGALAVTGTVLLWRLSRQKKRARARVSIVPALGPDGLGLTLSGSL